MKFIWIFLLGFLCNLQASDVTQMLEKCEQNNFNACFKLGVMFEDIDGDTVKKDDNKSKNYLKKACDGGVILGCFGLGVKYMQGRGVEKDINISKVLRKGENKINT